MKAYLVIDCGNAAFNPSDVGCDGEEVARILHNLAHKVEANYLYFDDPYSAFDINGNKVGQLILKK